MDDECDTPSYPWSWRSALVMVGDWTANVPQESAHLIEALSIQVAADVNYRIDQRSLHEQMARELETILGDSDG